MLAFSRGVWLLLMAPEQISGQGDPLISCERRERAARLPADIKRLHKKLDQAPEE
jgi:hypothetical protein